MSNPETASNLKRRNRKRNFEVRLEAAIQGTKAVCN